MITVELWKCINDKSIVDGLRIGQLRGFRHVLRKGDED